MRLLIFILIMVAVVFFFWHDEISLRFTGWQSRVEEEAPAIINQGISQTKNWWENYGEAWADELVAKLTDAGKVKIDEWLDKKGYNQYGDQKDTMYAGGAPLFNEATGQSIDRYVYLLKKFPDLISQLNLEQYLK